MSIKKPAQAEIENVKWANPVIMDVNFDEEFKDCVQITIGEEKAVIRYSDLFSFMFTIASKEQQAQMVPLNQELGHEYMKQIRIKCKRDMKEGEELVVNLKIHVPNVVRDSLLKSPYLLEQGE